MLNQSRFTMFDWPPGYFKIISKYCKDSCISRTPNFQAWFREKNKKSKKFVHRFQKVCSNVAYLLYQFNLWQQQASLLPLKPMVSCISRTRDFLPKT